MIFTSLLASLMGAGGITSPADTSSRCYAIASGTPLDKVLAVDEFRIRYTLNGPDAPVDRDDANHNGIPDVIENIGIQLVIARAVYRDLLGLRPPLDQPRYAQAHGIDVLVRRMNGVNGLSYDEVTRRGAGSPSSACALTISLTNDLRFDRNPSPAHELFHLYQYGYALFKRAWYLEGMARWIESAFVGPSGPAASGAPSGTCSDVATRSYDAADFWRALAQRTGGTIRYPAVLRGQTYVDGRPVLEVPVFPGGGAIRPWLEALDRASGTVAARDALPRYAVPEAVQKSPRYDGTICQAVERAAADRTAG